MSATDNSNGTINGLDIYLSEHESCCAAMRSDTAICLCADAVVEAIRACGERGGKVLLCGNGGSAALCEHFAAELMGRMSRMRAPIAAVSLTSNASLTTCIANDYGYDSLFARQVDGLGREGDYVIALSTGCASKNIHEALEMACVKGLDSLLITGSDACIDESEYPGLRILRLPASTSATVQDLSMLFMHYVCDRVEASLCVTQSAEFWHKVLRASEYADTLLLDRDGVVNVKYPNGYISRWEDFKFTPGFLAAASELAGRYKYIFIVSNQKGVGKGVMSIDELALLHRRMSDVICQSGGRIDDIFIATTPGDSGDMFKPGTGLANEMLRKYPDVDMCRTVMVGDSYADRLFASRAGVLFIRKEGWL